MCYTFSYFSVTAILFHKWIYFTTQKKQTKISFLIEEEGGEDKVIPDTQTV